jgi:Kef-type K+ transport system membrane component KefB
MVKFGMNEIIKLTQIAIEYQYIATFAAVLLLPKLLIRLHIPTGFTALILGCICTNLLGWFDKDQMIITLARLGITSLFLFAGMEIDIKQLKENIKPLCTQIAQSLALIVIVATIIVFAVNLSFQISLIISIAIFTPSAGFILSSLKNYELSEEEIFWIKLKAISKEISAVLVLFFALQMNDIGMLLKAKAIFLVLLFFLPYIFKFYLKFIAPYATKSEVSFLVIMAFLSGILTKKLGTHYLVGAFATGVIAGQYNHFMGKDNFHRIENTLSAFYSIFVPFYFFSAGLLITSEFFSTQGLIYGLVLSCTILPIRIFSVFVNIKYFISGFWNDRIKISISLAPNLIFGLVVVGILKERFNVDAVYLSGIIIYTLIASILPAIFFDKVPPEDYDLSRSQ